MELVILRREQPDEAASPEHRYLASLVRVEAESVWGPGEVEEVTVAAGGDGAAPLPPAPRVLVLGNGRLLVGRASLRRMGELLDAGTPGVVPVPLAEVLAGRPEPVHTLRGFESVERRLLRGEVPLPETAEAPAPLPVSLLERNLLEKLSGGVPRRWLATPPTPGPQPLGGLVRHGLFHAFVDYYGEVRADVLPFLPEGVKEVLEVGCGRGVTGHMLQERLGCRVTGVELNPVVAGEAARLLHRVVQGDVGELELEGRFDAVLALELIEHLPDLERVLGSFRRLLRPGGRIVLSLPNVGHWSVVEDLLAGRWDYLPIGLLCYTHFRFFTARTLSDWLRRCGYHRFTLVPQTTEPWPRLEEAAASGLELDRESLATKGFWALIEI